MEIKVIKNSKRPIRPNGHPKEPFTLKMDLTAGQVYTIRDSLHQLALTDHPVAKDMLFALSEAIKKPNGIGSILDD